MSETIPEKLAIYFSTMNSLSSKIFSEVQLIDESIGYTSDSKSLTYNERCAVVDKCLIHDALVSKPHQESIHERIVKNPKSEDMFELEQKLFEPIVFGDECLDQSQTDSLIRFVYPKKPEKYVFDDNGCWIDEHSQPFSYCKESQAKCCQLEEFAQKVPAQRVHDLNRNSEHLKPTSVQQPSVPYQGDDEEPKPRKERKKPRAPFFGVNVMGGLNVDHESLEDGTQSMKQDKSERRQSNVPNDDNLPKQKQNLDLIAELQAKLDRNKITKNMNCPPPPPPGYQNPKSISVDSPIIASPITSGKISKPKAPPPPPPAQNPSPTTTKHRESIEKETPATSNHKPKNEEIHQSQPSEKKTEDFMVDVSSPCRIVTPKTGFDFLDNW